ncbi:MAG: PQQ-dependent sugar dehydrogenase [Fidelibacterota bacterium]|nr:PQQ-dependent sugar dehydrogenase [Candidatus Neomarinimicrobiota bacterium]
MKKILILMLSFLLQAEEPSLSSTLIADGFKKPLFITSHPENSKFLYVVEQAGKIIIINNGKKLDKPFLDITDRVVRPGRPGDERGLLGFAFHPDYAKNKKFYVNYINDDGFTIVSEFSAQSNLKANSLSERTVFNLKQPYGNHNGGHMQFGPDNYLYISIGDGGKRGDPLNAGQDLNTLFGKIIRIDINKVPYGIPKSNPYYGQKNKRGEIWAWGFRNVWRFSFDRKIGDIYYGDVGQNKWEEINYEPYNSKGGNNYGWRIMEASKCYNPEKNCDEKGLTLPIHEYPNDANYMVVLGGGSQTNSDGCSVTGGYVYRGSKIKGLNGYYIFGDYCSGNIWTFKVINDKATSLTNRTKEINLGNGEFTTYISSFGEDADGELYIVEYNGGIYKIDQGD